MPDWKSPLELANDAAAFSKLMHVLLGLYLWEFATSLYFELDFIKGKKTFRWPLIFYFAGRYSLLFALIGIAVALNVTVEVNCQALYTFNQVFGNMAIGFASINLSLRTIAVWSRSIYVVIPLVGLILGHWSFLLHGLLIKAAWIPADGGCAITNTNNTLLAITFIYSMGFDLVVLCLTAWKLSFPISSRNGKRSQLVRMIFGDGLIFFIVAFLANLIATVFMLLNLNAVMSIIFNVPAAIASTIVASRAVRRLTNFTSKGPEVFPTGQSSTLRFGASLGRSVGGAGVNKGIMKPDGVHVQMDTFTLADNSTNIGTQSFLEYDERGQIKNKNGSAESHVYAYDPEAQEISDEFKRPPY